MTIYQEEMQRKAQHYGCITSYDESDQLLLISHKGVHLTAINPEGFMFYNSKDLTDISVVRKASEVSASSTAVHGRSCCITDWTRRPSTS